VLKDLRRMSPNHQITMLKFIKNLSMLATTHDSLQNSGAIEALTDLLGATMDSIGFREISNQVLNVMYNLCRLSKTRQEDAALNGIIPILQKIVKTEWPLKEFALPILCDMAHSGKICRKILWQNKGLQFYISLLADKYWQVTALDAIFIWYVDPFRPYQSSCANDIQGSKKKRQEWNNSCSPATSAALSSRASPIQMFLQMPSRTSLIPSKSCYDYHLLWLQH